MLTALPHPIFTSDPVRIPNPYPNTPAKPVAVEVVSLSPVLLLGRFAIAPRRSFGGKPVFCLWRDFEAHVIARFEMHEPEAVTIRANAGYLTDLISVPAVARPYVSQAGEGLEAAILHDRLYDAWQELGLPASEPRRTFADMVFREVMRAHEVPAPKRWAMYRAVRLFGGPTFRGANAPRNVDPSVLTAYSG